MNQLILRRVTGISGIFMYLTVMTVIPLFFVYDGAPPVSNILTRVLVNMFTCAALIVFLVGFREIIRLARPESGFLASLAFTAGLTYVILLMVADSVQVGSALAHGSPVDPTLVGSGGEASLLIWGPLARLLTAIFLAASGGAILVSGILPRWTAWLAFAVAAFHLALVPTIFSGTDPSLFYSINGLGIPTAGGLFGLWILVVSIVLLVRTRAPSVASA